MSGEEPERDDEGAEAGGASKTKEERETAAVTDFHQEVEGDLGAAQAALDSVAAASAATSTKALFTGTLAPEDVALVQDECDLTKEMATQLLNENDGKPALALKAFISAQ